jgi:hypothetical protein
VAEEALDPFPGVGEFYEYRGIAGSEGAPPIWIPYRQGDVFSGIDVPGLEPVEPATAPSERLAMVFMHPCVMRSGAVLAERITVFRVRLETKRERPYERFAGNYSVMPLPDLLGTGAGVHLGEFQMVGTVPSAELDRANRIMSLTNQGRLLLQQRAVHHFTRHAPPLHDLRARTRNVERETGLLADWCEGACDANGETADVVEEAEKAFDEYLSSEGRRDRLGDDDVTHEVSAEVHREIRRRFGNS